MLGNLNGWHLVIILFLVLLLFGAPKLPGLARSVGQSMKIFKNEVKSDDEPGPSAPAPGAARDELRHPGSTADAPRPDSSSEEPTSKPDRS